MNRVLTTLGLLLLSCTGFAAQSLYCPQKAGYINVGMTEDQVRAACGEPLSKQESNNPIMQKVQVQQLFFNNQGSSTAFYGVWSLPVGTSSGAQLQVDVVNNKVYSVKLNGSDTNAFSICGGTSIQVGDPVGRVYGSCGNPSLVNNTYINQPVATAQKPQLWIYQPGQYQSPVTLTFVDGKLQSID
ncbi:DUF2845 domain-containing protein [Legionella erythra]|uniref:DUF2845 domain-containing protein n=1 Tax=Legionella erythra TaxID=448 RepID=A0A0W0TTA3_LEGER|nr:DUF2845 domain-containing protein [Legionella erythra]KTC98898.1 hypothetical protein Lery_0701 [Legionella erythra]